jgi:hypothetical protein
MTFQARLATKADKTISTALAGPVLQGQVRGRTVVDVNA